MAWLLNLSCPRSLRKNSFIHRRGPAPGCQNALPVLWRYIYNHGPGLPVPEHKGQTNTVILPAGVVRLAGRETAEPAALCKPRRRVFVRVLIFFRRANKPQHAGGYCRCSSLNLAMTSFRVLHADRLSSGFFISVIGCSI